MQLLIFVIYLSSVAQMNHFFRVFSPFLFSLCVKADDIEFDAQVPAAISSGAGQRHPQAALQHVSHLCLQGDGIHRRHGLSK